MPKVAPVKKVAKALDQLKQDQITGSTRANDTDEILAYLKHPSNFERLIKMLPFHSETILNHAAEQPQLFVEAARLRVQTKQALMRADARLDEIEAETSRDYRQRNAALNQKVTENAVKEYIITNEDVLEAQKAVRIASAKEEFGMLLLEAYRHRRDMIRVIAENQRIEGNDPQGEIRRINENLSRAAREAVRARNRED